MDALHRACLFAAGVCLVVITLIIPWGVFTRYVLNSASSWPEPMAVLLMIVLSFLSAVICYREYLHIGVGVLPALLDQRGKAVLGWIIEACMMATNVFMVWFGITLVQTTFHQSIAEFPLVSVGVSYLPVPVAGAITALFIVERLLTREFFRDQTIETTSTIATE
jgi:TRAP-type C4-dicarboxylate transport system permease small subunit